jgi:periplasmic protein TonB
MPLYKTSKADLRGKYNRNLEISAIVALIFLIAAFKYSPQKNEVIKYAEPIQDLIKSANTEPTEQTEPPPKPKPVIPQISMDPEIKDIEFETNDLIVDANVDKPPVQADVHKIIENEDDIFIVVEDLPQPIGGLQAIQSKIHYTDLAMKADIQGKVIVLAIIDTKGNVIDARVAKSLFPQLDEIALDAVKSTKFSPGKQRGKPVKVQMTIPITFKLK